MIEKGIQQNLREKIEAQPIQLNPAGWSRDKSIWVREKILHFVELYPEICEEIFNIYKDLAEKYDVDMGTMRMYWVGGRIQDKAITPVTDLDIVITFDSNDFNNISPNGNEDAYEKIKAVFCKYGLCDSKGDHSTCNQIFDHMLIIPRRDSSFTDPTGALFDQKKFPRVKIFERKVN
jgi:hypothetical protein